MINEGAYADIILINGDPTTDIRLLMDPAKINRIIKNRKINKNTL